MGRACQRLGRNTTTGVIEVASNSRGRQCGEDVLGSEQPRRTASHERVEETRSDGSFPGSESGGYVPTVAIDLF